MTDEPLAVATSHRLSQAKRFGFLRSNVEFRKDYIEDLAELGVADNSVEVVISNCVINLPPQTWICAIAAAMRISAQSVAEVQQKEGESGARWRRNRSRLAVALPMISPLKAAKA